MADPERVQLLEEIADGVVDMLDGEPSGSDSLDWALERYGYVPTKGVAVPEEPADPAGPELPDSDDVWFCFSCEDANVTRSDEDRCCLMCGVDLTSLGHVRALLATQGLRIASETDWQLAQDDIRAKGRAATHYKTLYDAELAR